VLSLSVITVTYNAAGGLRRTLESAAALPAEQRSRMEWILVDGASTDETILVAQESGSFDTIVSEPDAGIYDAMNRGAELARGQWLQFLNAGDTLSQPVDLGPVLAALDSAAPSALWAVAQTRHLRGGRGDPIIVENIPHVWWRHALGLQAHAHPSTFVRRSVFDAMGGYRLDYGPAGDMDLILRLGMLGRPIEIPVVIVDFEGGGVSDVPELVTVRLLEHIRKDRFQLTGIPAALNRAAATAIGLRRDGGAWLSRLRRRGSKQVSGSRDAS